MVKIFRYVITYSITDYLEIIFLYLPLTNPIAPALLAHSHFHGHFGRRGKQHSVSDSSLLNRQPAYFLKVNLAMLCFGKGRTRLV